MRFFVLLLSLALLAAGPFLYLEIGGQARERRIAALEELERHRVDLLAEAARGSAPSLEAIERLRSDLAERVAQRTGVTARILTYRPAEAASEDALRTLAKAIGLDAPRLEPLLRPMPPGELGAMRRQVLHAVLKSLERAAAPVDSAVAVGSTVADLKIAREPSVLALDSGLRALRVDLTLRADANLLTRITESLLEVHAEDPFSDLEYARLTIPDPKDMLNFGTARSNSPSDPAAQVATPPTNGGENPNHDAAPAAGPPLVLVLALDYVVAEVP